jgi:predicted transcriptional regulator
MEFAPMSPPPESLGPLELEVLQYISDHHPISVREVAAHFAEQSGHARTTLLTVMERLRAKGFLTRRKSGGLHRYRPTLPKGDLLHRIVGQFVDEVLGGSVSPFFAYLTRTKKLTPEQARKLEEMIQNFEARQKGERP